MRNREVDPQTRAEDVAITALRAVTGVIMTVHGSMKLLDIPGTVHQLTQIGIPYPQYAVYLAIAGEFLGGLGLLLGCLTRLAALGTLSSMAVAIGYVHFGHGLLASHGGWEYPLMLALVSMFFVTHGAGPFSVDALFTRDHERSRYRSQRVQSYV